jgi:hypothetical protein
MSNGGLAGWDGESETDQKTCELFFFLGEGKAWLETVARACAWMVRNESPSPALVSRGCISFWCGQCALTLWSARALVVGSEFVLTSALCR